MSVLTGMSALSVRAFARALGEAARTLEEAARGVDQGLERTGWAGTDAAAFTSDWTDRHRATLVATAAELRQACGHLERQATEQEQASGAGTGSFGGPGGGFRGPGFGGPGMLLMVPIGPTINPVLRYLVGLFGPGTRADGDATREGVRASDDADRRQDDRFGGRSFENDWAGRRILANYMLGGPDMRIDNDPEWSGYMMSIDMLAHGGQDVDSKGNTIWYDGMQVRNDRAAQAAVQSYLGGGGADGAFGSTFSMAIPNGESITGVNYLHGTNEDAGGFVHQGATHVEPLPDGTYRVSMDVSYQWNDRIDPNNEYSSDVQKNSWAEFFTLGRADDYDIHIGWSSQTAVIVDAQGNVVRREGGWPA